MAEAEPLIFLVVFVALINQGYGDEMGQMGVLHAEGSKGTKDFCIVYNPQWPNIPTELDQTPKYSLVESQPPTLCGPAKNPKEMKAAAVSVQRGNCTMFSKGIHAQDAFASEVIIVSNDTLFTPEGNLSAGEYNKLKIPLAVISMGDWRKLKTLGDVKVQLYAPPAANVDGNLAVMWVLAVCTVAIGAYWAGITNRKILERRGLLQGNCNTEQGQGPANGEGSDEDGTIEVTPVMVLVFVILICGTLLLLYFFYDYLVYIVIALFCIAACNGLFECLRPIVLWLPLGNCKVPPNRIPLLKKEPQIRIILLILFCMSFAIWWGIERNKSYAWILQDILGISFCISLIKTIRLSSLKVCTILLVLLLIYDIFFVFITPLFSAGKSVMVEVATGGGNKEQLPMVLKVPRLTKSVLSVCQRPYSLLGFGDILVPGLYIGFCHSFDIITNTPHKIYYTSTTIAYGVGLVITFVMLFVMQQGQPALLYLVPCTLITGLVIGWLRGDLKKLWTGRMLPDSLPPAINSDDNEDDVILSRSRRSENNDQGANETERLLDIANVD